MPASRGNVATRLRARAPVFAAFFARPTDELDVATLLAFAGVATTYALYGAGGGHGFETWALTVLSAGQVAVFAWALAALLRLVTRRVLDSVAYPVAASLIAVALAVDRVYYGFFRQHVSLAVFAEALDALRTKAIPFDGRAAAACLLSVVALSAVLVVLLKALSFIPRPTAATAFARRAAVPVLLAIGTASSLRECVLDPQSEALLPLRRAIPWDGASTFPTESPAAGKERAAALFGDARPFDQMRRSRERLLASPLHAATRPDILFVHVESLRFDMLRDEVSPRLSAFAKECLTTPFHYTTGTNTGTGAFGLLTGLTSPYYPLSRAAHAQPIPVELLRRLGYGVSVFFISNFGTYDGLYDLFFGGLADFTYQGPDKPVYDADAKMVDAYIAQLRAAGADAPRFDYLILDSSHYDYSYPPDLEIFKPSMSLDLGPLDGMIVEKGVNDRLKWRAPYVRNRYQNSVHWADSLVGRIIDALRESRRLEHTIVVITGDHGEEFWEHGSFGHGFFTLANEQSRVPLLMHLPGGGSTRYRYSSHADVFPTIFDAMGLEPGDVPFMNGKSLLRYDALLDDAVVGFGVARNWSDVRLAVVGDGLKVYWRNVAPFDVSEVVSDGDDPLPVPPPRERVDDLVFRAVAQKELR
jgi:phosphoglycerol transferase MdoB-like AlkP superfamily enzyme